MTFERRFLSKCKAFLIISSAPYDFIEFCRRRDICTIVRVDGFSVPLLYDNKEHPNRSFRELSLSRLKSNQEIQLCLAKCDFVIFQSYYSKYLTDNYLYARHDNYTVIYNGVNTEHFKPVKKESTDTNFHIGIYGTLRDTDIVFSGLESFRKLHQTNSNARLSVIGTIRQPVNELIRDWLGHYPEMESCLTITGTLSYEELPPVLGKLDVGLHLTSGDYCPNAVLEHLASGTPVICVEWGGTSELVGDAGVVLEHPKYDYSESLSIKASEALRVIYDDYQHYSQKARRRAIDHFDIKVMAEKYNMVLNR